MSFVSNAQQCTLPSQIFLPTPDHARFEQFGSSVSVDGDYMIAGLQGNSSTYAYDGVAYLYKLDGSNSWQKIAELTASDAGKYTQFGKIVSISGNTIVISGSDFTDSGDSRAKMYVFNKPANGEWVSSHEDYVIAKPRTGQPWLPHFNNFVVRGDELIAQLDTYNIEQVEVYRKSAGVFQLEQVFDLPGGGYYDWNIAAAENFFAISNEQFHHADQSSGAVFIYEKSGGVYKSIPAVLIDSQQASSNWRAFGLNIAIFENTLFVQGTMYTSDQNYSHLFYVIEKPASGWVSTSVDAMFKEPGLGYYSNQLAVNQNYLIATDLASNFILGFKKPVGGWNSSAEKFIIDDTGPSNSTFASQVSVTDNHLLIGCPNRLQSDSRPQETILDIYRENGDWENVSINDANVLTTGTINATDDFFGEHFSVHSGQLAIAADGDDKNGWSSGAVYLFDLANQNTGPQQMLYPPEEELGSGFGQRMAVGDSIMFITAPYKDSIAADGTLAMHGIGKVYVYRLNSSGEWKHASQIIGQNIYPSMQFGVNVAWTPGYCAISEFNGGNSSNTARVYIYRENKENGKFEFVSQIPFSTSGLGYSMTMTDSLLVIGGTGFSTSPEGRGEVLVVPKKDNWNDVNGYAILTADNQGWNDGFGKSVSIHGDYIVVGAPRWPGYDPRPMEREYLITGAAYVFKRPKSGWRGTLKSNVQLTPPDGKDFGSFGAKVAIDHNDIFVGAPGPSDLYNYSHNFTNNDNALNPGKVYHFTKPAGGWQSTSQETRQIESFEPEVLDGYGSEMYVSDRYLFVGALLDDTQSGIRTGSVQTMMQLPAIDELNTMCLDEPPVKLNGFPKGGHFSGTGVNSLTNEFSPAVAGAGTHSIKYERNGCEAYISVLVISNTMIITNRSSPTQTKCVDHSISIAFESNEHADSYFWYYRETTNGKIEKYDSARQVIQARKPGIYQVVVDRGACQPKRESFTVLDESKVIIDIASVPVICSHSPVSLTVTPSTGNWTGPGISLTGVFDPTFVEDNMSHKVIYTVVTPVGCVWKDSIMLNVDLLDKPVLQYDGSPICGNKPVTIRLTNVDDDSSIAWFKNGAELNSQTSRDLVVSTAATYFATVSNAHCMLSSEGAVVPREDVKIVFNIPVLCDGEATTLDVTPAGGVWEGEVVQPNGNFDASSVPNGNYLVQYNLTTPIGCLWQQSVEVVVDKLSQPILTFDTQEVCRHDPASLALEDVDDRSTFLWHSKTGGQIDGNHNATIQIDKPGTYWATVVKGTCVLKTEEVTLTIIPDSLYVPNVFTANNDALNDNFEIRAQGMDGFHLSVFNRYGRSVYESDNIDFQWDGGNVSSGIYFWRITYRSCADTREEEKGWVQVIK